MHYQDSFVDHEGHYIFVKCSVDETPYTLASIYAPNINQLPCIIDALTLLNSFQSGEILIGYDLNIIMNPTLNKTFKDTSQYHKRQEKDSACWLLIW